MCVLLVDDEAVILLDVAGECEAAGHEVHLASDGLDALAALDAWPGRFSALVTDQRLPGGINGTYIIVRMRKLYPNIPIIVATGSAQEISEDFRQAQRVHVIPKPFAARLLVEHLNRLMDR